MTIDALDLFGDPSILKVSATDIASADSCPRHLAVKIRPDVKSRRWRRSFGSEKTFVLGIVTDLVRASHSSEWAHDPQHLAGWIAQELERRRVHRLLRPYATAAVTNILEAHWDIEDEIGPLQLFQTDPTIGTVERTLTVWGPLYRTEDGVREVRRYRLGAAHVEPTHDDLLWTHTAAQVAAGYPSRDTPVRIRVVEIGAADGSIAVLFDGTPDDADSEFSAEAKHVAGSLGDLGTAVPGSECASCKVAGACDALIPVPEVLGQPSKGYASRSVSPSDLDRYQRCPAQWFLADARVPRDAEYSGAQTRGLLVHTWLETAHARGVGCTVDDLPEPGGDIGLAATVMDADDYAIAHPYLRHHVSSCPLATDGVAYVASESAIHGFDHDAEVIPVTKPDLVFRIGDRLVAREVKTTATLPAGGADDVYADNLQVPFLLAMLGAGVAEANGCTTATVEVEMLTPGTSEVYAWDLEEPELAEAVRADVAAAARDWHVDAEWHTQPGPHCAWCPVRQWCPDRQVYENQELAAAQSTPVDDEPAPF
ncbi:PD-(D/E)XK nuclease family protein [Aeromicrobium ginsengisoli]|uniref:PD-(D/E)XK nuclease family protein n=1 Tax=Aeromicrobium ginsengisoli TaxID=363867 RepID=A0A5M4FJJ5_9ACTN|nr:PD-(D/E)XK nuclease family protein [Aeromicrobium ginsengisoli]KAA1400270.1 PD-(D/E)XK nuclease family protein [Aeromicrobium ginsengisoli]